MGCYWSIVVKNRRNGAVNPNAYFDDEVSVDAIRSSPPVADPLRRLDCPAPCDGAVALVITDATRVSESESLPARVAGVGHAQAASHLTGGRSESLSRFPAFRRAADEACADVSVALDSIDLLEPYAPFPHVEAILTEELGYFPRGRGAAACERGDTGADGTIPVSPSGGCLGRGHPPLVTPMLNYADATAQLRGTAPTQVDAPDYALTTSEHGHVDGATATILARTEERA